MNKTKFFFAWALPIWLGWGVGAALLPVDKSGTIIEVLPIILPRGFLQGALIGLLVALGHWLAFNRRLPTIWIALTIVSFALLAPIGLIVGLITAFRLGPIPPTMFFAGPATVDLIFGGWFLGLVLWPLLRPLVQPRGRLALLWIVGTWASLGFGVFAGLFAAAPFTASVVYDLVANLTTGALLAAGTGGVLLLILDDPASLFPARDATSPA